MNKIREKIIVTGSNGLVGKAVSERLLKNYTVIGLDREKEKEEIPNLKHFDVDFASGKSIDAALQKVQAEFGLEIASVIHLATYYDFTGKPNPKYDTVTVQGTSKFLNALQNQHFETGQFIFASTLLVHEPTTPGKPINEDSPINPKWPYPESKTKTENMLLAKHDELPLVILRMAGVYDDHCHSLPISRQIQRIYERWYLSHFYPGDKTHGASFVHLDDLVDAFVKSVDRRKKLPNELTLLIGEAKTLSFEEMQREIGCSLYGQLWTTLRIPEKMAQAGAWVMQKLPIRHDPLMNPTLIPFADDHYEIDIGRAEKFLGWTPKHGLRSTIPKMIEFLKSDPIEWYKENKIDLPDSLKDKAPQKPKPRSRVVSDGTEDVRIHKLTASRREREQTRKNKTLTAEGN